MKYVTGGFGSLLYNVAGNREASSVFSTLSIDFVMMMMTTPLPLFFSFYVVRERKKKNFYFRLFFLFCCGRNCSILGGKWRSVKCWSDGNEIAELPSPTENHVSCSGTRNLDCVVSVCVYTNRSDSAALKNQTNRKADPVRTRTTNQGNKSRGKDRNSKQTNTRFYV